MRPWSRHGEGGMSGMKSIKRIILDFILWCSCLNLVRAFWVSMEVGLYGVATSSQEDTIISILFSSLLWWVVCRWQDEG